MKTNYNRVSTTPELHSEPIPAEQEKKQEEVSKPVETKPSEKTVKVIGCAALNIRLLPRKDSDIVGTVKAGETLIVTGDSENGFLPVKTKDYKVGYKGFVMSEYTE